jgi:predicted TIM-barrel fold metal-dependent hydrolase
MASNERLISADSHVAIGQAQVKQHLAPKFHDEYDGAIVEFGRRMSESGAARMNAAALDKRPHPSAGRPGYSDPHERLADMDTDGVEAEVLYCEVSAFRYLYLCKNGWREATRAFNDAMLEFGAVDPKRLIVNAQIPIHDIDAACDEVERVIALGVKSLQLPVFPSELGLPDYFHDRYDRLWSLVAETGLPVCHHIGLNTNLDDLIARDPTPMMGVMVPQTALSVGEALGMWMLTGALERHRDLKIVFVEPGLGWVAWYLYIVDDMATRQQYDFPEITELPSAYFHRNLSLTYIEEPDAIQLLRHRIGVENILWSSDYPHPVSSWPNSRALVEEQFRGVPEAERELIVSGNAARVWNL